MEDLASQALELFQAKEYDEALVVFTQAIDLNPKFNLYEARCATLENLGQLQSALLDAKECCKLQPESYKGYWRAGKISLKLNDTRRAVKLLEVAVEKAQKEKADNVVKKLGKHIQEAKEAEAWRQASCNNHISLLPLDIFLEILSYLSTTNRVICAHVCSSWRRTIFSCPTLWGQLVLHGDKSEERLQRKCAFWKERLSWMTRAGEQGKMALTSLVVLFDRHSKLEAIERIVSSSGLLDGLQGLEVEEMSSEESGRAFLNADIRVKFMKLFKTLSQRKDFMVHLRVKASHLHNNNPLIETLQMFPNLGSFRIQADYNSPTSINFRDCLAIPDKTKSPTDGESPDFGRKLEELDLTGISFSDCPFRELRNVTFPRLRVLDIGSLIRGSSPTLRLNFWNLSSFLSNAPNFEVLRLRQVVLVDFIPVRVKDVDDESDDPPLFPLRKLKHLSIQNSGASAQRTIISHFLSHWVMPSLVAFTVIRCDLAHDFLPNLSSACPLIETLKLNYVTIRNVQGDIMDPLLTTLPPFPMLRTLDVSECAFVSDPFIRSLSKSIPSVTFLILRSCRNMGGAGLSDLVLDRWERESKDGRGRSGIKLIDLENCHNLQGDVLAYLRGLPFIDGGLGIRYKTNEFRSKGKLGGKKVWIQGR
ncbi:RNI-like protein [Atractiella rhizophila]|nr:RNI-like protein [Atractiella rhizophila]